MKTWNNEIERSAALESCQLPKARCFQNTYECLERLALRSARFSCPAGGDIEEIGHAVAGDTLGLLLSDFIWSRTWSVPALWFAKEAAARHSLAEPSKSTSHSGRGNSELGTPQGLRRRIGI